MRKRRKRTKILSLLCCICMIVTMLPTAVFAGSPEADEYIGTPAELMTFAAAVNGGNTYEGKTVALTADIDLTTGTWATIIGSFNGTFNGNGKKISNSDATLFTTIGALGTVQNLGITGIAGCSIQTAPIAVTNNGTIENCFNIINITGNDLANCGGIVEYNYGTIQYCFNAGPISGNWAGGIAGRNYGRILNCYNAGAIAGTNWSGGIIGWSMDLPAVVQYCYNIGDLSASRADRTGSIIGRINGGTALDSYFNGPNAAVMQGTVGANVSLKTDAEMKDAAFLTLLNVAQAPVPWVQDATNINGGYPILTWQAPAGGGGNPADTEAPTWTAGAAITASDITTEGFTVNYPASDDNVGIYRYKIEVSSGVGIPKSEYASGLTKAFTGLLDDTTYTCTVVAEDVAGNQSAVLTSEIKTLINSVVTLSGATLAGTTITLKGLPANASNLEYSIVIDGTTFTDWAGLTVNGTTASVERSGVLTGTSKVGVRVKDLASASAEAIIYAALGADIPMTQNAPVIYEGGLKVYPDQLQSGGVSTVNVRNANSEVPGVPEGLLPKSGLAACFYGVNVKGPDGSASSKVTVSLPLGSLKDYDIEKISVYRLDTTWKGYSNWWMPMLETDKSEINDQIIKVALWNFDSKGIDEVLGVFENPIYMTNTIYTQLVSQTDTTVTLRVGSPSFGVAKFKVYRDGKYIGDNTGPIVQKPQTECFEANFTDTPPGPGTYVYNATAVDNSGNEHLSDITYDTISDRNDATVVFGSGQDDAASVIAAVKAGLEDGSISLGFTDGDSADSVTQNIDLPLSPIPNAHITWTSNRSDVFKDKNTTADLKALFGADSNILKPADTNDVSLVLTATITSDLDNNCSSETIDIPITVRWMSVAHVAGPEEFKRALPNSVVQTVIIDSWFYSPDGLGSTEATLSGTYDCQGKTIRGWAILENGTVLKNAVFDAYGKYYSTTANSAPIKVVGGATFDNVTFTGLENSNYAVDFRMQDYYKTANIQITNCNFGAAKKGAINIDENRDKVRYDLNADPSTITISGNNFDGGGKPGYAIKDFVGMAAIEDNTISGYQGSIDNMPSAGIFLSQDVKAEISGNTITDCDKGIMVWTGEALTYQKYNSSTGEYTYNTVTSYTKVNGSDIIDGSSAEAAGKKLLSANLITPAKGDGNSAVIFSNAVDSNNPILLYEDINGTKLPPTVSTDTTDNMVNQDIELTFSQDSTWENAITSVKVDGNALTNTQNSSQYTICAEKIQIVGSVFNKAGDYDISIEAEGYAPAILTQTVIETPLKTPPTLATTTVLVSPLEGYQSDPIVDITFTENVAWRSAITGVTVCSMSTDADQHQHACSFSTAEGKLTVGLPYNHAGGTIIITVMATGYADAKLTMDTYLSSPILTPDTSGNSVGQDIDVYFDPYDYMNWVTYITDVKVDNVSLNVSQCKVTWGSIHIDGRVFTKAGTYTITVSSGVPRQLHFLDTSFQQDIVAGAFTQTILRAQSLDNYLGKDITLTFADNQTWREAVSGIYLNGESIDSSLYSISEGQIKLDNKVFSAAGTYTITVKAIGFDDGSVTQLIAPAAVNLVPNVCEDNTDTMVSRALDLAFSDNAAWRTAIVGITYYLGTGEDQTTEYVVSADKYTIEAGNIHIEPNVFPGLVYIHIKATGYCDAVVRQSLYTGEGTPLNPPTLTGDTTNNVLGQVIEIAFHDADWRKYISNMAVNNTSLTSDQYTVSAGKISINGNAFSKSGTYTITISAANLYDFTYGDKYYLDASVSQTILAPKYTLAVVPDNVYTPSVVNGVTSMTVNSNISGFKYFTVNTTPVNAYYTKPMVVFVQIRNNSQIAISATSVASAESDNAVAGFSVKPGDLIKAYIVDRLTNDININPVVLQ